MALAGEEHPRAKLTEWTVLDIRARYAMGGNTYQSLADEYGVDVGTVSAILRGKSWGWLTGGEPVRASVKALATHCAREHEFTPENTIWTTRDDRPRPTRTCRKCANARVRKSARAKRGNYR